MERLVCLPWCSVERTVADTETLLSSIIDAKHIPHTQARTLKQIDKPLYVHSNNIDMPERQRLPAHETTSNPYYFERYLPLGDRIRTALPDWLKKLVPLFSQRYQVVMIEEKLQEYRFRISGERGEFTLESVVQRKVGGDCAMLFDTRGRCFTDSNMVVNNQDRLEHWRIALRFSDQNSFEENRYSGYHEGSFSIGVCYEGIRLPREHFHWASKPLREAVRVFGVLLEDHRTYSNQK